MPYNFFSKKQVTLGSKAKTVVTPFTTIHIKALFSVLLISIIVILLPAIIVTKSYELPKHGSVEHLLFDHGTGHHFSSEASHGPEQDNDHHENHHCCHSPSIEVTIPSLINFSQQDSLIITAISEYHFVIVDHHSRPDFRPPIPRLS